MLVQQSAWDSARQAYQSLGEQDFRKLEHQKLSQLVCQDQIIVATGGGIVEYAPNRSVLSQIGTCLYLDWPFSVLAERQRANPGAFLGQERLFDHWQRRHDLYTQWADISLSLSEQSQQQVFALILNVLEKSHAK